MDLQRLLDLLRAVCIPLLLTLLLVLPILHAIYDHIRADLTSDIARLPSPPLPFYKTYTVGHNIPAQIFLTPPLETASIYNDWHRHNGDIYTLRSLLGERVVIPFSPVALREIQITKHASFSKTHAARAVLGSLLGQRGILLAEGKRHTRLRRAVQPAMHHRALLELEGVFLSQAGALARRLGAEEAPDVLADVRTATFDVIFETCLGRDAASEGVKERIMQAYTEVFAEPPIWSLLRVVTFKFLWFVDQRRFQHRQDLRDYLQNTIYELCKQNSGKHGDTLLAMMEDDTKGGLDNQERVETVLTFLVAGQVTTSISVCWTLYLLAKHPDWQEKLLTELEGWQEDDGLSTLDELPTLSNVVRESLRLYPPVLSASRTANQAVILDGYRLPKGAPVRIPVLAMHRSEQIWGASASEFNPDRFLDPQLHARTKMFWCPFLLGPRSCIGQRFAILEIKAFTAQIVKMKRVFIKPMQDPPPKIQGPLCTPKDLLLYFEERS